MNNEHIDIRVVVDGKWKEVIERYYGGSKWQKISAQHALAADAMRWPILQKLAGWLYCPRRSCYPGGARLKRTVGRLVYAPW